MSHFQLETSTYKVIHNVKKQDAYLHKHVGVILDHTPPTPHVKLAEPLIIYV